ncbi:SxtJ family membrane protein [Candidatus Pelagibacter bacterium nBUS_28]|uniref:SxtJ family membrane protein n=1 Tax=Candidatus Pelagibacter bacterium nBUS_28 TaxID=3374189 RepID=UPI003EBE9092|tara:strand:- start:145 stop:531 length:387 start_codon:yes stop_codon:yes gene_type:complete
MNNIKASSVRSFGIVFFLVFIFIAFYPLLNDQSIRIWSLIVGFIFLFLGIVKSPILKPLNIIWFKFGIFLGKFIAPIVMGVVYFAIVFPTFLLLKLFKRNYLNIKYERNKNSYWLSTKDKNTTMKDQF